MRHNVSMYCVWCAGRVVTVCAWMYMWRALQVPAALRWLQVAHGACRHWQKQGSGQDLSLAHCRWALCCIGQSVMHVMCVCAIRAPWLCSSFEGKGVTMSTSAEGGFTS